MLYPSRLDGDRRAEELDVTRPGEDELSRDPVVAQPGGTLRTIEGSPGQGAAQLGTGYVSLSQCTSGLYGYCAGF